MTRWVLRFVAALLGFSEDRASIIRWLRRHDDIMTRRTAHMFADKIEALEDRR